MIRTGVYFHFSPYTSTIRSNLPIADVKKSVQKVVMVSTVRGPVCVRTMPHVVIPTGPVTVSQAGR